MWCQKNKKYFNLTLVCKLLWVQNSFNSSFYSKVWDDAAAFSRLTYFGKILFYFEMLMDWDSRKNSSDTPAIYVKAFDSSLKCVFLQIWFARKRQNVKKQKDLQENVTVRLIYINFECLKFDTVFGKKFDNSFET